jgi:hypothetical protein
VKSLKEAVISGEQDVEAPLTFEYGDDSPSRDEGATDNDNKTSRDAGSTGDDHERGENVFLQESTPLRPQIEVFDKKIDFRQSNRSRDFATPADDNEQQQQNRYIQMGTILHELFSTIRTTADIDDALRRLELEGVIYDERLTKEKIGHMIHQRLTDTRIANWFSDKWTLFNECSILFVDPKTGEVHDKRPDRVMTNGKETIVVDFKFGKASSDYHEQVREYMQLLRQMGHTHVEGYLWYVYQNKIEKVKPAE